MKYAHLNGYDGLVMLTDGYAPPPLIPDGMKCRILWVCQDQGSYKDCEQWMRKFGMDIILRVSGEEVPSKDLECAGASP